MNKDILYKYIVGDATSSEKEEVVQYIEADEKNMKEFLALRKLYTLTIWQENPEALFEKPSERNQQRILWKEVLKIAAIFIIAFSMTFLYHEIKSDTIQEKVTMQTIYVPAGQRAELTLADSTKVWLNAKTTLTFPSHFDENNRSVILDGEGYFNVTHKKDKPFIVKTKQYDIKVLGTEFNVYAYESNTAFETSLLKGSVQIQPINQKQGILLEPNEKAYIKNGQLEISPITQYDHFLWKDGLICFDDITINELFQKLQLYFDVQLVIENNHILKQRYTGKFRTSDGVEHALKTLQLRTKFRYEKINNKENTIIIK